MENRRQRNGDCLSSVISFYKGMNRLTSSPKPRPYPIPKGTPLPDDVATLRWLANFPTREEWEAKEQERIQALEREISRDYPKNGEASSTGLKRSVQLDGAPHTSKTSRHGSLDHSWTAFRIRSESETQPSAISAFRKRRVVIASWQSMADWLAHAVGKQDA
jgi:hypothetical protein